MQPRILAFNPLDSVSEFFENLMNSFCRAMYDGLYSVAESQFKGMFESLNDMISDSTAYITQSPQAWSSTAFSFIKGIAENACIPLAGCIITFVFCMELVHMVQDNNQMHAITPEKVIIVMLKLGCFLLIASKSFDIVMGVYDIGSWAAGQVNPLAAGGAGEIGLDEILLRPEDDKYTLGLVFTMLINMILICLARVVVFALAVAIFVQTNLWYLELLIYTSVAPLPMSTFMNREWGQIGNNYVRKIIAVCFQGFFMLVAFGLYSALVTKLQFAEGDDFMLKLFMTIGCGVALFFILCKSGNISASVFNAH
ncbi:MAG: hypothetical protein K1W23_15610 [Lachnospiraceae bacterium]